jgi:hypothetical protein
MEGGSEEDPTMLTRSFTMRIEGAGIQSLGDESWGIDKLRVTVGP